MTATAVQFEEYRPALTGHCYRMLGSVVEAEDAVQESMLRAWKNIGGFRGQASLKSWLHRIATNVCLDTLGSAARHRFRPVDHTAHPEEVRDDIELTQRPREYWVEPIPDAMALPAVGTIDPEEHAILRESIQLAFVAALQYLPPRQRAVLLLTQVLNWSAAETAEALGMTAPAVNSALQRARATLASRKLVATPRVLSAEQTAMLVRYVDAFERYDVTELASLLREDVTLSMPPFDLWLRGRTSVSKWFLGHGIGCKGSRLVPVEASGGMPAFAQYRQQGAQAWALILLELDGPVITGMTSYLDVETLFPRFGLALTLDM